MALFGFGRPRPDDHVRRQVEAWAREAGSLGEDVVVKVNEIVCPDPACPGLETVILVMRPGRPARAVKCAKPLAEVERDEVVEAIHGLGET